MFANDTNESLGFVANLVNTVPAASASGEDELSLVPQLHAILDENRFSGRRDRTRAELEEVVEVRDRLARYWELEEAAAVAEINEVLSAANAVPQLVDHDDIGWHLHATADDAPLAQRILVEAAMALSEVVRAGGLDRLRRCEADDCGGVLVDTTRNHSKRYCSVRCSNRMNAAAFRERAAETAAIELPAR
ncbi:CGNR zinc finger domain-containing protein [Homoserinibacter sp. YIM 151385]|uniref:CGNR zinc finger domain-containing protein n=1 Tax=Homoserinibacter sp. YIM 151385 TaxID=2985506 RepID=UPI0022F0D29B|nr:CGNR zinc finger domain-containing protein [Homoserinibacter sp. YIM 151385]WBU38042.1 CGNR zinc finger domain-containing protein [Homoserinibacter sp. YIM 151385]